MPFKGFSSFLKNRIRKRKAFGEISLGRKAFLREKYSKSRVVNTS